MNYIFETIVSGPVRKFLSNRLIMNSRRLWNSHERYKFLRAEACRDIWKIRVSEMAFPEVFKSANKNFQVESDPFFGHL